MKNKKYHSIGTIPKSDCKVVETETKLILYVWKWC